MSTLRTIRSSFAFFSRIPVGKSPINDSLKGLLVWLPLVGIVIGAITGGIVYASSLIFPPLISGLIGCAAWIILTGGLHLDGVADCGDGLPVEVPRERRLEIMKDSRLGTFGGTFLFFNIAFKFVALATLAKVENPWFIIVACAMAGLLARNQIFMAIRYPMARPGGMGDAIRQGIHPASINLSLLLSIALSYVLGIHFFIGSHFWIPLGVSFLCGYVLLSYAIRRLGGVTGDVFGWLIETTEWVVLLTFCIRI